MYWTSVHWSYCANCRYFTRTSTQNNVHGKYNYPRMASKGIRTYTYELKRAHFLFNKTRSTKVTNLDTDFCLKSRAKCRQVLSIRTGTCEPPHDKTNKMNVRQAKTQISLGIRPVWSESSQCAQWVAEEPNFLHADNEVSNQTGRLPRLIWVFAGRTVILLVLSGGGSCAYVDFCAEHLLHLHYRNAPKYSDRHVGQTV